MRAAVFAALLILAGCAQAPVAGAGDRPPNRSGYRLVNRDGGYVYCRTDLVTASHIQSTTTCLTPAQLAQQDRINQQDLGAPNRPISNPHGSSPL